MRAIQGEHLNPLTLDVANPAGDLRGRAVPRNANRILVGRQARLARREAADRTERDPRMPVRRPAHRSDDVSHHWDADQQSAEPVQRDAEPEQEPPACLLPAWL